MARTDQFTDTELLESVTSHLAQFIDRGDWSMAWAMGATWASRNLLMADVLSSIRRRRELGGGSDEELASAVASRLRFDNMVVHLEHVAHERHQAEFRARLEEQNEREAAERAADPVRQAKYEAEQAAMVAQIKAIQERAEQGSLTTDSDWIRERLRELTVEGAGHRMALDDLARENTDRLRRVRLVHAWLAERAPAAECPPWATQIFEEAATPPPHPVPPSNRA